jgi:putative membrane protein
MTQAPEIQIPVFRSTSTGLAVGIIMATSAAVFGFLIWLIYLKPAAGYTSQIIASLPAVNATLNTLSTVFLIAGLRAVLKAQYNRHMKMMLSALASSALFFVCYVIYHNAHGDTKFTPTGPIRPLYFSILISHIILSGIVLPLILTSFYLALAGKYTLHRKVSKFTFPIWLYVSVTGVVIFAMLKIFNT